MFPYNLPFLCILNLPRFFLLAKVGIAGDVFSQFEDSLFILIPMLFITDMISKQSFHCSVSLPFTWFY